jgi:hypothetical protein
VISTSSCAPTSRFKAPMTCESATKTTRRRQR